MCSQREYNWEKPCQETSLYKLKDEESNEEAKDKGLIKLLDGLKAKLSNL